MILDGHKTTPDNRLDVSAGGLLVGTGDGMSDSIFATSPSGAFVLNAETTRLIGAERLDRLVGLALVMAGKAKLSAGEYVIPQQAIAVLGRKFFHTINLAGNLLRDGDSPDPQAHKQALLAWVDRVLACLHELHTKGVEGLSPEFRKFLADRQTAEDGITFPGVES
jgi:hypothetical protein